MGLLQWRSMGVLNHFPRATKTELLKGGVKSEIERDPRNSRNVCGRRGDGRTEMGKNWTKGKGKNSQRKYDEGMFPGRYSEIFGLGERLGCILNLGHSFEAIE